ncbi:MAG: hypothetical protein EA381_14335, partial [Planctomycetaceae bacterium]
MFRPPLLSLITSFCLIAGGANSTHAQALDFGSSTTPEYDFGEELLRGPVHEAFAEQYNQDVMAGAQITVAPPPNVPEVPPQVRPSGDRIEWLPGYWFFDDDRNDFIWVSGVWRQIPPGLRWLPGYWDDLGDSYHWVAGTWVAAEQTEIEYLAEAPPESLEMGPVGEPPTENHFWIPGSWTWQANNYAWRPGYYSVGYSDWVWVPQRYLWTPGGYVFCRGYWDYPLANRGVLFAPFHFQQPVYLNSGFFYTPRVSIFTPMLQNHFWVRPGFRHYYFGDFYANRYRGFGIYPWHAYNAVGGWGVGRRGFDPLFSHYAFSQRGNRSNVFVQVNNQYNTFVNQVDRRPPSTYRDLRGRGPRDGGGRYADVYQDSVRRDSSRYTRMSDSQWNRARDRSRETPELASLRRQDESRRRRPDQVGRPGRGDAAATGRPGGESGRPSGRGGAAGRSPGEFSSPVAGSFRLPSSDRWRDSSDRPGRDAAIGQRPTAGDRPSAGERPTVGGRPAGGDRPAIG